VKKIKMLLDRDEFVVTYDPAKADSARLIARIKESGYTAQVVGDKAGQAASSNLPLTLPQGFPLLDGAMAHAKREKELIVLDFFAEWCAPCKRMEKTTFADARVKALLERCVVVRIDTDQHVDLAAQLGVVGLPDIRFVTPAGKVVRQLRGFQDADAFAGELERFVRHEMVKLISTQNSR
jgi:thiol:disulfide interchange protein